jgi:5-methylcytosine-specific restriction endonuclease McrA
MKSDVREKVFLRDLWQCQRCGLPATEIAHKIAKTDSNVQQVQREYLPDRSLAWIRENIINHQDNLVSSCRECNDYFNVGFNPVETCKIIKKILDVY